MIFLLEREYLLSKTTGDPTVRFLGPRRKEVLRGEGNAWTPVLRSFDKLREVGVSSYLFYSWFKCFVDVCVGLRSCVAV